MLRVEIPSTKVYEDETTLAFRDIAPQAPVHVLVIPKKHVSGWYDAQSESDETLAHLMRVAAQVAKSEGIVDSGFRVVSNCGDDAQQTVKHLHLHVLRAAKRWTDRWPDLLSKQIFDRKAKIQLTKSNCCAIISCTVLH